ncbi:MAG: M23 family metallopeptidase [Methylocystis sp.]|nr:M23 family metallopeptidase [Methylocystis sp.]MCA3584793.1 M23 family metallopeptidase [Methylocystis sp.]MCA3589274.1 M23 family metallopeptidase [Methylocystis sp.]MCA3593230.1 M23 family metallopeptidase [Methylocystis sp.]
MASRSPVPSPFSNTTSPLSIVIGKGPNPRIIGIRPWVAASGIILAGILMAWYLVATLYFVFRDEMLARLLNQQTEMQYAYEDRLAALRNQIDKVTSRQLLDQNTLDGKLHELLSRQAQLETRQTLVNALAEQPIFAGMRPAPAPASATQRGSDPIATGSVRSFAPAEPRPLPVHDAFELRSTAPRDTRAIGGSLPGPQSNLKDAPAAAAIAAARNAVDQMEQRQVAVLNSLDQAARGNAQRLSSIFAETGLDPARFASAAKNSAQGGPLVPMTAGKGSNPFEQRLAEVYSTVQKTERMRKIVNGLPISRPMPPEFETTSGFGPRSDPFTRTLAMHTGIDFRAPSGAPVRATAPGKVTEAGYAGGYGNMVEIDHGNGLSTRYAHLSSINVDVGDSIAKGGVLGRVGTTGRSTGPHLHYETRIDGDATDPSRFIRAGQRMGLN